LKPSPPFVAGLTLCIAFAKATLVAKIRIKQFWAIPLAGKVVAPCPAMAMPCFFSYAKGSTYRDAITIVAPFGTSFFVLPEKKRLVAAKWSLASSIV